MDPVHAFVLAVLQGFTEFLPISSSGHLILVPALLGWRDQGLAFDIAVHLGTLLAVVAYFRRELFAMGASIARPGRAEFRLLWHLVAASVPLGLAGLLFSDVVETRLRSPLIIAAATAGFGVLLWLADARRRGDRSEAELTLRDALLIGCAQALALVPGTSRSGITITVALALGASREAASRFSFLLAVPAIGMAAAWQLVQFTGDAARVDWLMLALGTAAAAATAFVTIALFLKWIGRIGMGAFALYRFVLAAVIVYIAV